MSNLQLTQTIFMNSPVELRVGSNGAGAFIGCGAGIGFLTPVSLHAIPVIGQLVSSLTSSMAQFDHAVGGWGRKMGGVLNSNSTRLGLNVGVGCGVAIGYGWGIGIMLKPNAVQTFSEVIKANLPGIASIIPPTKSETSSWDQCGDPESIYAHDKDMSCGRQKVEDSPVVGMLEKDIADLTKIVLKQQVVVQNLEYQIAELQQTLAASPSTTDQERGPGRGN